MKAYKVFDKNLQCRGLQYTVGEEHRHDGPIELCARGIHFCQNPVDCFKYYSYDKDQTRICEIEVLGQVQHGDDKSVTDHIRIIREIPWDELDQIVNTGKGNTGYGNTGNLNSGDLNSGDRNSGDRNSGYRNSGDWNSGYRNSGYRNSGDRNSGDRNSGYRNSGDRNSGYRNSGDRNSGDRNSGSFNKCNHSAGFFNTQTKMVQVFDGPMVDRDEFVKHPGYKALMWASFPLTEWISESAMTDEEKEAHLEYKTTGGFVKVNDYEHAWARLWLELTDSQKQDVQNLPGFNWEVFTKVTGIQKEKHDDRH